jgi:hypothetical protein
MRLIMRERQAASCLPASIHAFRKAYNDHVFELDMEGGTILIDDEMVAHSHLENSELEGARELLRIASKIGATDTKFDQFVAALESALAETPDSKVLVFSYFRGTLEYLSDRLRKRGWPPLVIHGGVPVARRHEIIEEFRRDPARRVLLSSEVGAEGLDFQFCDVLFNYDLPWNPMRVEQRIGRLDRFGQTSPKIRIFNLVIEDTIETRIFQRLYERIRIFESSIGDLEEILGEKLAELSQEVFRRTLSPEEEMRRADEIAEVIERKRQEEEEFEQAKGELLGQDRLLEEEVRERIRAGNFISAEEIRALVETGLQDHLKQTRLEDNGDGTFVIRPSAALRNFVIEHYTPARADDEVFTRFLSRFDAQRHSRWIPITFDQDRARERPNVEFVTLRHPLAQAIVKQARRRFPDQPVLTKIVAHAPLPAPVDAYFFLYLLTVESVLSIQSVVAVLFDAASGHPCDDLTSYLLSGMQAPRCKLSAPDLDPATWRGLEAQAKAIVARQRDELAAEERSRNEARLAARRASIERFYESKIRAAEDRAQTSQNAKIVRMKVSEAANLRERLRQEIADLERRRTVVANYRLFGGGVVRFTAEAPPARLPG